MNVFSHSDRDSSSDGASDGASDRDRDRDSSSDIDRDSARKTENEIPDDERELDALLKVGGAHWREQVPAASFEQPSSRVSMLGRGARIGLTAGISAAVVGIMVAGSTIFSRQATPVAPQAPAPTSISTGADRTPSVMSSATADTTSVDDGYSKLTESQRTGTRLAVGTAIKPSEVLSGSRFPPTTGSIWVGWDVPTGHLLIAIRNEACLSEPGALTLIGPQHLALQFEPADAAGPGGTGSCAVDNWVSASYAPPSGLSPWTASTIRTPVGEAAVLPLGGLVLPYPEQYTALPSVTAVQRGRGDARVSLKWQPDGGRLLVIAPYGKGCRASASAGLGEHGAMTVLVVPSSLVCLAAAGSATYVIQLSPRSAVSSFAVTVATNITDPPVTQTVFDVPPTKLADASGSYDADAVTSTTIPGVAGILRTSDGRLILNDLRTGCGAHSPFTASQTGDQQVRITLPESAGVAQACPASGFRGPTRFQLLGTTDPTLPLTVLVNGVSHSLPPISR